MGKGKEGENSLIGRIKGTIKKHPGNIVGLGLLLGGAGTACPQREATPTPTPEPTKTPIERCFYPSPSLREHLAPLINPKQDGDLIAIGPNAVLMGRIIAVSERPDQESLLIGVNTGKKGVVWVEVPSAKNGQFGLKPPNINVWDQRNVTGWSQAGLGAEALQQVFSQSTAREVNILIPLGYSEQQLKRLGDTQREAVQQTLTMNNFALGQTLRQIISVNSSPEACTFVPSEFSIITYKITPPVPSQ